jgi:uncharacterized protein YdeI (YjbR/CyaY-like superfamily)
MVAVRPPDLAQPDFLRHPPSAPVAQKVLIRLEVNYKKTSEFIIPEEFQNKLDKSRALKTAFNALTPGRQRGYILYFSAPKQSKTRGSRIEKCMQQILNGKGLND